MNRATIRLGSELVAISQRPTQYAEDRRCAAATCSAVLSRYNQNEKCAVHHELGTGPRSSRYFMRDRRKEGSV